MFRSLCVKKLSYSMAVRKQFGNICEQIRFNSNKTYLEKEWFLKDNNWLDTV